MKCKRCNGAGKYKNTFGDIVRCDICYGTGKVAYGENDRLLPMGEQKQLTNEEYIRSCTFDELAGEIYEWYSAGYTTGRVGLPLNSITEIVEWLKEKHHD